MEDVKGERRRNAAAAAPACGAERRRPLAPSDKNNAAALVGRRRESPASRFKPVDAPPAPPAAPAAAKRCHSPSPVRAAAASADGSSLAFNRARSADRARPAAPSSAPSSRLKLSAAAGAGRSATPPPPQDAAAAEVHGTPPRARNAKAYDGLWASASPLLRSEHVQSPVKKVDRLVQGLPSEQPKSRSGAAAERKTTSPLRRSTSNLSDHCENARPSESPATAATRPVAEQHRWPGMMTGRGSAAGHGLTSTGVAPAENASSNNRSVSSSVASAGRSPRRMYVHPSEGTGSKSLKRPPNANGTAKIAHRRRKEKADSSSDTSSQTSESSRFTCRPSKAAISSPVPVLQRSSSPRQVLSAASSTTPRSCQSPSRMRPSAPCCRSKCQTAVEQPVFSCIVDARKGKKNAGQIENVHQLRLLHNRYLQWRFVNAHSEVTQPQRSSIESILYSVWKSILTLRDALTITKTNVRHLQHEQKLHDILTEQIGYLERWLVLEADCSGTLLEAIEALKACTLRLPVTSGAQADGVEVRNAISSAVDVMQALSSSICYVQSKVEDRTSLVSELSVMSRQEKVALDQCRELLATTAKLQVQETSLRTHLMQIKERSAG